MAMKQLRDLICRVLSIKSNAIKDDLRKEHSTQEIQSVHV